ncbi:MAG: HPr(Ser) kinase/phosphatase [Christensenellaceae bacterium]|jgi:HPr kinase/phosphorylase|nr:HPr(Ser) kinase/phosphatase [Christensenellaceae bacterium]
MSNTTNEIQHCEVSITEFAAKFDCKLIHNPSSEFIKLESVTTNRPSFILAGWMDHFSRSRIQVFGRTEITYLKSLDPDIANERIEWLCSKYVPCIIVSRGIKVPQVLLKNAQKYDIPVFSSKKNTPLLIHDLFIYLNDLLAPTDSVHGILIEVFGIGVLIKGRSGIGKSETALELVHRGNRLVSDDVVDIKNVNGVLYGTSPAITADMMEVRGLGIINIRAVYGIGSILKRKRVQVIIEIEDWDSFKDYARTSSHRYSENLLGEEIPKYIIPIIPGRNIAILIEAAVSDFRLREDYYNPVAEIESRMT